MKNYIRWGAVPFAVLASLSLAVDTLMLFAAANTGEKLHPELMEHWPMNIVLALGFWCMVFWGDRVMQ